MVPVNNSDLAWLVTSDYNEDNGILGAQELREDIYNPEVNDGEWEFRCLLVSRTESNFIIYYAGSVGGEHVGGGVERGLIDITAGDGDLNGNGNIGGLSGHWTEQRYSQLVGGNYDNPYDNYVC